MNYVQGFVIPVPTANRAAYLDMATRAAPIFAEYGATRTVECWGDDVMDGKVTDLKQAVKATDEETIVFAWVIWPDRATCDAATEKLMADERIQPDGPTPFDMQRAIYAGFEAVFDTGEAGRFGYADGMVAAAPAGGRDAFIAHSDTMAGYFRDQGATRVVDCWGANVPDGKFTDFRGAVQAAAGDAIIFGWIEWPDKATRDAGMAALMKNEAMRAEPPAWHGPTAIFGGFVPILDTDHR